MQMHQVQRIGKTARARRVSMRATEKSQKAWSEHEKQRMRRALELARQGDGYTDPNPIVGCVIEDAAGHLVGEGYHPEAGLPHAEVYALRAATNASVGATAYVTLEPCAHIGRTPPCARALRSAKVARCALHFSTQQSRRSSGGLDTHLLRKSDACKGINPAIVSS